MPLHGFEGWPRGPLHIAIGVFDGVHRGHQQLIQRLREEARTDKAAALATTFDPLPIDVLAPGAPPSALSSLSERIELLRQTGADDVVVLHFDAAFAGMRAQEFVERLAAAGDLRRIVTGPDFRFGHGREGNNAILADLARPRGIATLVVGRVEVDGAVVSSTRIRNFLLSGDVRRAADLLGRPYAVTGRMVRGASRGRSLGYPTIVVAADPRRLLPRDGIYASWVTIGGRRWPAATSLGVRATFVEGQRALESHLLDLEGELHGEEATTSFVERVRDELRFESAEELVARIAQDVEATRRLLGGGSRDG